MAISVEESNQVKEHLLKQLTNFPEDRREEIKNQINAMTSDEVENFVKQNQMTHLGDQCIICAIAAKNVQSFDVAEDDANLAVLEITPLSKGHTIAFPKNHNEEISSKTKKVAELASQKLMQHFSPKKITTNEIKIMGHNVLEVIPIYGDETERKKATPEELSAVKEGLSQKLPPKQEEPKKSVPNPSPQKLPQLKPRIP